MTSQRACFQNGGGGVLTHTFRKVDQNPKDVKDGLVSGELTDWLETHVMVRKHW